jgi:16S rRNA (guanine527-N7)-methyltransferase
VTAAADRSASPAPAGHAAHDVSRETGLPAAPAAARAFLGDHLDAVVAYATLLAGPGVERGLIGPHEIPRLWDRHLLNCAVVSELIPAGAVVDDVGSGAGLPGIVLALVRPDLEVTLVEPLLRRATFLSEAVDRLGLGNVVVSRERAEDRARTRSAGADVVVARAVAPLGRLVGWCLPLVRPGGCLLALKGEAAGTEVEAARADLRRAGAASVEVITVGAGVVEPPTTVIRVVPGAGMRRARRRT